MSKYHRAIIYGRARLQIYIGYVCGLAEKKNDEKKSRTKSFSNLFTPKIDAEALVNYFEPLIVWLKKELTDQDVIGWKISNPNVCPNHQNSIKNVHVLDKQIHTHATILNQLNYR